MTKPLRIIIPDYRPPSWNLLYAGGHWTKRQAVANEAHTLVRAYMPADVEMFTELVDITVTAYFENRPLDADNIVAKVLIDGLITYVLIDDKPLYVRSVKTISLVDKDAPRVVIDVEPVGE